MSIVTKQLKQLLGLASRGVVLKRNLPKRFGAARIYVSPDSALRFWHSSLERCDPTLFQAAADLVSPGDVVWDVGANVGMFAFAAAAIAGENGRVLAIEPDTWLASLLNRSASELPIGNAPVKVIAAAVSEIQGITSLNIAKHGRASNSIGKGRSQTGGVRASQSTLCVTLDWLADISGPPNVLKIDVEGVENLVLRGGARALANSHPRILCEVGEENAAEVTSLLISHGYTLYDADEQAGRGLAIERAAWSTIALPSLEHTRLQQASGPAHIGASPSNRP